MIVINNFDVLKRMAEENKSIQLCATITQMNYSAKKGGTEVSVGVPGNVCFEIESGRKNCLLLLFDIAEFNALKAEMEILRPPMTCSMMQQSGAVWALRSVGDIAASRLPTCSRIGRQTRRTCISC